VHAELTLDDTGNEIAVQWQWLLTHRTAERSCDVCSPGRCYVISWSIRRQPRIGRVYLRCSVAAVRRYPAGHNERLRLICDLCDIFHDHPNACAISVAETGCDSALNNGTRYRHVLYGPQILKVELETNAEHEQDDADFG
jgi:hypothetical protein